MAEVSAEFTEGEGEGVLNDGLLTGVKDKGGGGHRSNEDWGKVTGRADTTGPLPFLHAGKKERSFKQKQSHFDLSRTAAWGESY